MVACEQVEVNVGSYLVEGAGVVTMFEITGDLVDPSGDRRHPVGFQFQSEQTRRPLDISLRKPVVPTRPLGNGSAPLRGRFPQITGGSELPTDRWSALGQRR